MVCLLPSFNRYFVFNKGGTIDMTVYEVKRGGNFKSWVCQAERTGVGSIVSSLLRNMLNCLQTLKWKNAKEWAKVHNQGK